MKMTSIVCGLAACLASSAQAQTCDALAAAAVGSAASAPASAASAASAPAMPGQLYMRDGQLVSWDLRVFVSPDVPALARPVLCLHSGHAVSKPTPGEQKANPPRLIARGQQWSGGAEEDGANTQHQGTLLLYALDKGTIPWWKPMMRVRPVVSWTDGDGTARVVVGPREVNIGNAPTAWALTFAAMLSFIVLLGVLARRRGWAAALLIHDDGHLSVSKVQMALWTLVIGAVVMFFGFVQLQVPDIPVQLVVLMGMSLITTGVSYQADAPAPGAAPARPFHTLWRMADLITVPAADGPPGVPPTLSLTRAQMLFWTGLLLILFVAKSVLTGQLWAIPWELIGLMGVSQAGYLAPKLSS